ncbi:MAG: asparagine synthase-related protein, partial [Pseudomonadota bacterium]
QALGRYMRDWRAPTPQGTLWPGLSRLPAGHRLTADAQGARAVRWWRPGPDPALAGLRPSTALDLLRDRLAQAVLSRRARVGGDPGALYSGGLDSSMVAGVLMGARPEGPLRLYALSSDRTEEDRLCRAAFGARWPASTLTEVPPGEVDPLEGPVHLWGRLAAPCADTSLPLISQAMRRAAQTGEAALLDGFGGDFQISALGESTLIEALLSARFGLAADAWRAMRRAGMGRRNLIALRLLAPLPGLAGAAALAAHGTERRPTPLRQAYDLRRTDRLPLRQRSADVEAMVMHQDVYPGEQELWDRPGAPPDQMPRLSPLLDTRLMSAIAGAPAALRVAGGWHRALPRALLDGLAPDEIRRRRGKNPTQPETWARAAQAMRARPDAWRAFREDPLWREVIDVEAADALYAALESRRDFAAMRPVAAAWHLGEFLRLAAAGGPP